MLPVESWLAAMTLEQGSGRRPTTPAHNRATARQLRRTVGRGLIALGLALAGPDAIASNPVSVGR